MWLSHTKAIPTMILNHMGSQGTTPSCPLDKT
jgi:hypothetical protein